MTKQIDNIIKSLFGIQNNCDYCGKECGKYFRCYQCNLNFKNRNIKKTNIKKLEEGECEDCNFYKSLKDIYQNEVFCTLCGKNRK
jgi:hypothetical protein